MDRTLTFEPPPHRVLQIAGLLRPAPEYTPFEDVSDITLEDSVLPASTWPAPRFKLWRLFPIDSSYSSYRALRH
jgi:hypothetical protein